MSITFRRYLSTLSRSTYKRARKICKIYNTRVHYYKTFALNLMAVKQVERERKFKGRKEERSKVYFNSTVH